MAEGPTLQVTLVHGSRPAEKVFPAPLLPTTAGGWGGQESRGREEGVRERREGKTGSEGGCPTGWIADPRPRTTLTKLTSSSALLLSTVSSSNSSSPGARERQALIILGQVGTYTYLIPSYNLLAG